MNYIIDTSGWIEYLEGSDKGAKINSIIHNEENTLFTIALIAAEVISKIKRKKGNVEIASRILNSCNFITIDRTSATKAGLLHAHEKEKNQSFSLADAIIITIAQKRNLKILTCDAHFKPFKEATVL